MEWNEMQFTPNHIFQVKMWGIFKWLYWMCDLKAFDSQISDGVRWQVDAVPLLGQCLSKISMNYDILILRHSIVDGHKTHRLQAFYLSHPLVLSNSTNSNSKYILKVLGQDVWIHFECAKKCSIQWTLERQENIPTSF